MPLPQRIATLAVAVVLVLAAAYLVRERRLRRPFGLVWGGIGAMLAVCGLAPGLIEVVGGWFSLSAGALIGSLCLLALVGVAGAGAVVLCGTLNRQESQSKAMSDLREEVSRLREDLQEARRPAPEKKPRPPALRT